MTEGIALIGFGEAGQAFAGAAGWQGSTRVYDKLTETVSTRETKEQDYQRAGVNGSASLSEALGGARLVLSLVTASEALAVAREAASHLTAEALYLDLNSVSPDTKKKAARCIEAAGARYVDVAIMAPVTPRHLSVPLLLSGPAAEEASRQLSQMGFKNLRVVSSRVGQASSIKMIRSVVVKGIEALIAEAMLAGDSAGVTGEVLASLDDSEPGTPWAERAHYCLGRMMVHGRRRADELDEAARMLTGCGVEPLMAQAAAERQRQIGSLAIENPQARIFARIDQIHSTKAAAA